MKCLLYAFLITCFLSCDENDSTAPSSEDLSEQYTREKADPYQFEGNWINRNTTDTLLTRLQVEIFQNDVIVNAWNTCNDGICLWDSSIGTVLPPPVDQLYTIMENPFASIKYKLENSTLEAHIIMASESEDGNAQSIKLSLRKE